MADEGEYNVIMSDFVFRDSMDGVAGVVTAHRSKSGIGTEFGNYINYKVGFYVAPGANSNANFCTDDGAVRNYRNIGIGSINDESMINMHTRGSTGNGWVIPADTRVD